MLRPPRMKAWFFSLSFYFFFFLERNCKNGRNDTGNKLLFVILEGARELFRIWDSSEERILLERERERLKPRGLFCCLSPPLRLASWSNKASGGTEFPGEKRAIALYMLIVVQSELYNSQPSPCRWMRPLLLSSLSTIFLF